MASRGEATKLATLKQKLSHGNTHNFYTKF